VNKKEKQKMTYDLISKKLQQWRPKDTQAACEERIQKTCSCSKSSRFEGTYFKLWDYFLDAVLSFLPEGKAPKREFITPNKTSKDLNVDRLDMLHILMSLEKKIGETIPYEILEGWGEDVSVGRFLEVVYKKIKGREALSANKVLESQSDISPEIQDSSQEIIRELKEVIAYLVLYPIGGAAKNHYLAERAVSIASGGVERL